MISPLLLREGKRQSCRGRFLIYKNRYFYTFCFKHNIVADSEIIDIKDVNSALEHLDKGDVKYLLVIDIAIL